MFTKTPERFVILGLHLGTCPHVCLVTDKITLQCSYKDSSVECGDSGRTGLLVLPVTVMLYKPEFGRVFGSHASLVQDTWNLDPVLHNLHVQDHSVRYHYQNVLYVIGFSHPRLMIQALFDFWYCIVFLLCLIRYKTVINNSCMILLHQAGARGLYLEHAVCRVEEVEYGNSGPV